MTLARAEERIDRAERDGRKEDAAGID
jgi:hypothetical protein